MRIAKIVLLLVAGALALGLIFWLIVPHPRIQEKSGEILADEVWSGIINVTDWVNVNPGVTLMIKPGTTVKFKHWRHGYTSRENRIGITTEGRIEAIGTPEAPIRFTSDADQPEHGDWDSVSVHKGGEGIFKYIILEFGWGSITSHGSKSFHLSNSIIRWSTGGGIFIGDESKDVIIENNQIYEAGHNNIEIEGYSTPIIRYNTIRNSAQGGIFIGDNSKAEISHNVIKDNRQKGIFMEFQGQAEIKYNLVQNNGQEGIGVGAESSAAVSYNTIVGNKDGGLDAGEGSFFSKLSHNNITANDEFNFRNHNKSVAKAENNWWGTGCTSCFPKKSIQGPVDYEPFLTAVVEKDEETGEVITTTLVHDLQNNETYAHPPGTENDTFPYVFPNDSTRKIVARYRTHSSTGLTWDGKDLWSGENIIEQITLQGKIIKSFTPPGVWTYGLAWDGKNLWATDYSNDLIYKMDKQGTKINSFPSPCPRPMALEYDGQYLWTGCFAGDEVVYKLDTKGRVIAKFRIAEPNGLAWDGEYMWVGSNGQDRIFKVDPSDGRIIGWITSPGDRTYDCTWTKENGEKYLWCNDWTNESQDDEKLFKIKALEVNPL